MNNRLEKIREALVLFRFADSLSNGYPFFKSELEFEAQEENISLEIICKYVWLLRARLCDRYIRKLAAVKTSRANAQRSIPLSAVTARFHLEHASSS
eukprot:UN23134